jgi:hypothetical protein
VQNQSDEEKHLKRSLSQTANCMYRTALEVRLRNEIRERIIKDALFSPWGIVALPLITGAIKEQPSLLDNSFSLPITIWNSSVLRHSPSLRMAHSHWNPVVQQYASRLGLGHHLDEPIGEDLSSFRRDEVRWRCRA